MQFKQSAVIHASYQRLHLRPSPPTHIHHHLHHHRGAIQDKSLLVINPNSPTLSIDPGPLLWLSMVYRSCTWPVVRLLRMPMTEVILAHPSDSAMDPDNKVPGANMGPTWVLSAPDGPPVGPRNLAIRGTHGIISNAPTPLQTRDDASRKVSSPISIEKVVIVAKLSPMAT